MQIKSKQLNLNDNFVDRDQEWRNLSAIGQAGESAIVVVYGRRRVGKTELLEQVYRSRNVVKFEGIESKPELEQMQHVLIQLAEYAQEPLLGKLKLETWSEVFQIIARYIEKGQWTLYFEEVQWLANYNASFIAELKYVWDNYFRYNPQLVLILCGSSPSFMIKHIVESKALHNRSQHELHLRELSLIGARKMLPKKSIREVLDAYLTVGGIPEYLKRLNKGSSVFTSLCDSAFNASAYFSKEFQRIFASSMSDNKHYKTIIEFLGKQKFATRQAIAKHLKIKEGGSLTKVFDDLELCGFIQKYTPYNLNERSKLARYCINDAYLQFYYKFIKPIAKRIDNDDFSRNPVQAIKMDSYQKWLGFSFERFCRKYHYIIANILGFAAIQYDVGTFYNKQTDKDCPNFQIDLLFDRADGIMTICEIKYLQGKVATKVIDEMERKIEYLPNPKHKTLHRVLICKEGIDSSLETRHYFDQVISIDDLFNEHFWR